MNEKQRRALALMNEKNLGAVLAGGRWVWKQTVRDDSSAASDVVRVLGDVCGECPQQGTNYPIELEHDEHGATCPNCGRWNAAR